MTFLRPTRKMLILRVDIPLENFRMTSFCTSSMTFTECANTTIIIFGQVVLPTVNTVNLIILHLRSDETVTIPYGKLATLFKRFLPTRQCIVRRFLGNKKILLWFSEGQQAFFSSLLSCAAAYIQSFQSRYLSLWRLLFTFSSLETLCRFTFRIFKLSPTQF